jgi:hypothetical protein
MVQRFMLVTIGAPVILTSCSKLEVNYGLHTIPVWKYYTA